MKETRDITVDYIGFPELLIGKSDDDYVKAYCKCPVSIYYGICIPRKPGKSVYSWYCPICCARGEVISHEKEGV